MELLRALQQLLLVGLQIKDYQQRSLRHELTQTQQVAVSIRSTAKPTHNCPLHIWHEFRDRPRVKAFLVRDRTRIRCAAYLMAILWHDDLVSSMDYRKGR